MESIKVPDGLPTLSAGGHKPGSGKACVMEYVSLLAGEPWSDAPKCTHPKLALAARRVNDALLDADRHRLVPLIGRLFGTDAPLRPVDDVRLKMTAIACPVRTNVLDAVLTTKIVNGSWQFDLTTSSGRLYTVDPDEGIAWLSSLIDEYDRLAGRTTHRTVSDDELRSLAATVEAGAR